MNAIPGAPPRPEAAGADGVGVWQGATPATISRIPNAMRMIFGFYRELHRHFAIRRGTHE
jgi:hypothetical protein